MWGLGCLRASGLIVKHPGWYYIWQSYIFLLLCKKNEFMNKILFCFRNYSILLGHSASRESQVMMSWYACLKSVQSVIFKLTWFCHPQLWWKVHGPSWPRESSQRFSLLLISLLTLPTSHRVSYIYTLQPTDMLTPILSLLLKPLSLDFEPERRRQTLRFTPTLSIMSQSTWYSFQICDLCSCIHFQIMEVAAI